MSERLTIDRLGGQGDGIAGTAAGPCYVPFALPGETVTVERAGGRARLLAVEQPAAERVAPACPHFADCGGCAMQHLADAAYRAWKRERIVQALASRGLDVPVDALVACPPGARRRVALAARRTAGGVVLGFHRAQSDRIVPVEACPVAAPQIVAALPALRRLATLLGRPGKPLQLVVTAGEAGLDVAARGTGRLGEAAVQRAVAAALEEGFARLSADGEVLVEPRAPAVRFGRAAVVPPPGGFLQAVAAAETAMAGLVTAHLAAARRVADLYAGAGAFALRLAEAHTVHAVEADGAALAALERGARATPGLKPVTTERRDLDRRPLTAAELAGFDGLVFDPPRAGAQAQARQIAAAAVPHVAAVSCSPGTLARDLAILTEAGYAIARVVPIDQFLWSPHVEAVALLAHGGRRRR